MNKKRRSLASIFFSIDAYSERERECVCVCVSEREREREREKGT